MQHTNIRYEHRTENSNKNAVAGDRSKKIIICVCVPTRHITSVTFVAAAAVNNYFFVVVVVVVH